MSHYRISVYVPASHIEKVKVALFSHGAGRIGNYDSCSWQTMGTGQFRPLEDSNPYLGQTDKVEAVDEFKLELVCHTEYLHKAVKAMIDAHPYEEPAYEIYKIMTVEDIV